MRWKLRIFGRGHEQDETSVDLTEHKAAARAALAQSRQALTEARQRQPEVTRVSRSLQEMRKRDVLVEMLRETLRESP